MRTKAPLSFVNKVSENISIEKCQQRYFSGQNLHLFAHVIINSIRTLTFLFLFQVINGLLERPDWESACQLGLGIIPGGSGNGLAKSVSFAQG